MTSGGNEPDPRVAVLQLLLADESIDTRRALIHEAFPDIATIRSSLQGQPGSVLSKASLNLMKEELREIQRMNDGASPLGRHAQERIYAQLNRSCGHITGIMRVLGYKT